MPQTPNAPRYTPTWHDVEEADERSWLDQWARLHLIPVTTGTALEPATERPARVLAGRP